MYFAIVLIKVTNVFCFVLPYFWKKIKNQDTSYMTNKNREERKANENFTIRGSIPFNMVFKLGVITRGLDKIIPKELAFYRLFYKLGFCRLVRSYRRLS